MSNLLFTHSYFLRYDPKQWHTGQPYAPLGTLYAAALMRENGHNVSLFDTMFANGPEDIEKSIESLLPKYFIIYDDGFNYLTKMCLTNMRAAAFRMIYIAKQKGCTVIVSSSDSTDRYKEYLDKGADFILIGEAENSLLELINEIEKKDSNFMAVRGIAFKKRETHFKTEGRPVLKELDSLPFPAWDLVNIDPYRNMWIQHTGYFSINMSTTRGCPFKCNWCAKPIYGNRYNSRSPENVVNELCLLHKKFHFDHIWFCDDIFGLKPGWVQQFAELMKKQNFKIRFRIQSRADLLIQENYVKALAASGCENVWIGAESGSQRILNAMDKGITVEQIFKATQQLRTHNIQPSFFIQFGYPGETKEDIRKTISMINQLLPYEMGISVSYPLPGTVFFENVKAGMKDKTNWTDSDELQLMFRNTYQPAFYKQLHRFVHKSYRMHIALENIRRLIAHPSLVTKAGIKKAISLVYYLPAAIIAKQRLAALEKSAI